MGSKATVAPVSAIAAMSRWRKSLSWLFSTIGAPSGRISATFASERTMLTSGMASARQILCSICPRLEAAAV